MTRTASNYHFAFFSLGVGDMWVSLPHAHTHYRIMKLYYLLIDRINIITLHVIYDLVFSDMDNYIYCGLPI